MGGAMVLTAVLVGVLTRGGERAAGHRVAPLGTGGALVGVVAAI